MVGYTARKVHRTVSTIKAEFQKNLRVGRIAEKIVQDLFNLTYMLS